MVKFRSTNRKSPVISFEQALIAGQAPDYGLYMPESIPKLGVTEVGAFGKMDYCDIAFSVAKQYVDNISDTQLRELVKDAYNFDVPIEKLNDRIFIMRLDRGPTASFKDFAARLMARLMHYYAVKDKRKLIVLVATSGDTGGAVADAFYGLKDINVVVLFPEKEVSERQRKQMTTLGKNVKAIAVKGKFDDCQALVKQAFNDKDLAKLNLTSANSINFGRLMPQMVYYFYAQSRLGGKVTFSVPSGNFGDLMGGVFAAKMGMPVNRFIVAVNENDEFPNFLKSSEYKAVVPSKECSSNAMNVGHPSNLARLIDLYGGFLTDERDSEGKVVKKGYLKQKPDMEQMRNHFESYSITDKEVDKVIKKIYDDYCVVIEPHGAVGVAAALKSKCEGKIVCLETADPAKFPDKIKELLGIEPSVPECLARLDNKNEKFEVIENDYLELKKLL